MALVSGLADPVGGTAAISCDVSMSPGVPDVLDEWSLGFWGMVQSAPTPIYSMAVAYTSEATFNLCVDTHNSLFTILDGGGSTLSAMVLRQPTKQHHFAVTVGLSQGVYQLTPYVDGVAGPPVVVTDTEPSANTSWQFQGHSQAAIYFDITVFNRAVTAAELAWYVDDILNNNGLLALPPIV